MAYKISDVGGWGTGALGAVLNPAGQINTYANVTAISTNTVTIGTPSAGIYETFAVGKEIMLHVSAVASGSDTTYLGNYLLATITAVNGSTLTLSKDVSGLVASAAFANYQVQAVTVAQFDTLNLTGTLTPLAYSAANKYGGILAFKCKTAFNVSGSAALNLVGKGIPTANIALRPTTMQEGTAAQIGWENHITARKLYLNCPDGAVFIAAKASSCSGTAARIGGTAAGVALYPYNSGTSNTAVVGGPTILWASQTISGFTPSIISKSSSNTSGKGLGRCYIATETKLPADEGLYALDCLSNPARLSAMGIKDFGTGALGTVLTLSGQVNSYAPVTAISSDGKTITIGTKYEGAYERFAAGSRVMFHVSRQTGTDNALLGKFVLANILSASGSSVVLDAAVTNVVPTTVLGNYKCQLITVAQFDTLANSAAYTGAKAYDDGAGCGGVLALAAKTTMDLSGGVINMEGKGIPAGTARAAVSWQCSGHQGDCLPLSQGNGAVLLIAKTLTVNADSRIGGTVNGAGIAGVGGTAINISDTIYNGSGGVASHGGTGASSDYGGAGGGGGGIGVAGIAGNQGRASSASGVGGAGGATIFIVANTLTTFSVNAISTGGIGGGGGAGYGVANAGGDGGAGYGGGGGGAQGESSSAGGGGGGAGTCFIYCNTITLPDYTAVLAS